MAATSGRLAGDFYIWVALRNSSGYPMGDDTTPDAVSNGETKHAYYLPDRIIEHTVPTPTVDVATFRAGLTILGQRQMGISDLGTFTISLPSYDEKFNNIIGGSAVDETTASGINITAPNTLNADLPQLILGIVMGYQRNDGTNQFLTQIWTNVQIQPITQAAGQDSGVNPQPQVYTVTPNTSTRTPMGFLFSATALAVQDNKDMVVGLIHDDPFTITTNIDDGAATSITMGYRPTSSLVDGTVNMFTADGVDDNANVSALSTTTGVATVTAGSAGEVRVFTYATNFVAI